MESELERFHKQNNSLQLTIDELKQRVKAGEKELASERQRVHDLEGLVRRFRTDLHNCVGYIQDPKMLKDTLIALYKKHAGTDTVTRPSPHPSALIPHPLSSITRLPFSLPSSSISSHDFFFLA